MKIQELLDRWFGFWAKVDAWISADPVRWLRVLGSGWLVALVLLMILLAS